MTEVNLNDPKAALHRYLRVHRDELLAKLDGVGEREVRWPMTQTGTNLLGLVKHVASVQLGYLGDTFGRPPDRTPPWFADDAPPDSDMWATADETRAEIVGWYRYSAEHADATVEALELDATGRVPWWAPDRQEVTLHHILVRMATEVARHAGHADIVRELIDGSAGGGFGGMPDWSIEEWAAFRSKMEAAAETAARAASD